MTISIIEEGTSTVTLVNVFTVDPKDQQRLVEHWQQATEKVIRHLPGFISANVHRSLDRTKVINYAQWESQEAFDAMRRNTEAAGHLRELVQIGTPAPVVCEVVSGYHV
jgi:heme-degrading monooxygenase HmoA